MTHAERAAGARGAAAARDALLEARVEIVLKPGILDPQGQAIEHALASLGFGDVSGVRVGKHVTFVLAGPRGDAERRVREICERLLANPVIEEYRFRIVDPGAEGAA